MYPVAGGTYLPLATATSTGVVTYSITTGNNVVCAIDSTNAAQVNFLRAGTCVVRAAQAGNAQYALSLIHI